MTTLRREIRSKIFDILVGYNHQLCESAELLSEIAEKIADVVLQEKKPKIDLAKADPAWGILAGLPIDTTDAKIETDALTTFERDMQLPDNWRWYPAKGSEDSAWKYLREFVVKTYRENPKAFQAYQTWRTQPYARGAMSNLAIKRNPENFPASWSDFLASSAMYGVTKGQGVRPVDVDDNDVPITY